ncbi:MULTISPECIES: hypothetical protein [Ureibacillus]|jgi:hypothetical protein|uniref:hypothetical protein n=1 Tax=Ureibacillus TaxID=160795 RepID=UPI000BBC72C9|nr:hypothetical protein [Ureibacillus thermosphaericus]
MFRKMILALFIVMVISFLIYPQKTSIVSVFRMTHEPLVISKGNYGQSLIVEISFTHEGLPEWLESLHAPYPILMLDAKWIERSPKLVELIQKKNISTGLLGGYGKEEYSIKTFNKEVEIYKKYFNQKPLWFMTKDYEFPGELKQAAFHEEINLLSPSHIYEEGNHYHDVKGAIISLQLDEQSNPNFKNISKFIQQHKFISLEENIFGYSIKSTKMP